ncbi:unnamed protein product [Brachionus calyciflorus]|uniref:Uncharacterized protein n=1 Tax=Brachionus calyciflorus TaxID=104777 RepID=A0A814IP59_9BILA|nr:unnamed protein product [Brachionus calyciflorus]
MGCFSRINFLKAENRAIEQTTHTESHELIFYQAIEFYLDTDNDQELIYFQEQKPDILHAIVALEKNFYLNKI